MISSSTPQKWSILLAIGLGTFMTALDASVVNTVLPVIRKTLNSDVASVEWVVTIYLLTLSGLLLSFGRLGDLRGHKAVYLSGFGLFVASSILCGLAPTVGLLVACRALQALGAAMLAANSPAILTKSFPGSQRGQALGLQATMTYLGLVTGPSLGGWLTSVWGWRAVFYINIPVGALALWLSARYVPNDGGEKTAERFDWPGALAFLAGLSSLLLGLNQGHNWGWGSPAILGLLAAAAALLATFVLIEWRARHPMLDLTLFKAPLFSLSIASAVFNYICVYSVIFLMPFYLIQGRGLDPAQAGRLLTAQSIVMAIIAPLSGTLSDRIGVRLPGVVGMTILSGGLLLLSRLNGQSPEISIILGLAVVGLGTGTFISPNNSAVMGSAPRHRQGIAAGMVATARSFGMVLGVGLAGAIFTTVLTHSPSTENPAIFEAVQASFRAAALVGVLGILTAVIRPERKDKRG
jgi:EmrB/QacA subfamily drug resistance transporter